MSSRGWHTTTTVRLHCDTCLKSRVVTNGHQVADELVWDLDREARGWLFAHCALCGEDDDLCLCLEPQLCDPQDVIPF